MTRVRVSASRVRESYATSQEAVEGDDVERGAQREVDDFRHEVPAGHSRNLTAPAHREGHQDMSGKSIGVELIKKRLQCAGHVQRLRLFVDRRCPAGWVPRQRRRRITTTLADLEHILKPRSQTLHVSFFQHKLPLPSVSLRVWRWPTLSLRVTVRCINQRASLENYFSKAKGK
eukprot:Selendium_serpulae@DN11230_c0_g1_i1.p1